MNTTHEKICNALLPQPHELKCLPVDFRLDTSCTIICMTPTGSFAGERLASMIQEEWDLHLPVQSHVTNDEYVLRLIRSENALQPFSLDSTKILTLRDEEYVLRVNADGAVIEARTARALLWGAMTLRQLITSRDNTLSIQGVEIQDCPRYELRGFMIDAGRAPNSLPKLKRIIRICSAFKLNAMFFREGDDELNAVRYNTNKLGSSNPFALSIEAFGELSEYASIHGITLIPEIESLGHSTAKGIHYPELVSGGFETKYEGIGSHIRKSHLNPCDPKTFELLESIYNEIFSTLREPFIHLGLDEVQLPADIQTDHMKQLLPLVFRCAERYGIEASPIVWADAPATPEEYSDRVYRCLWEYGGAFSDGGGVINLENKQLINQGAAALSQPNCRQRVLMAGGSGSGHTPYAKSSRVSARDNLASWAQWGNELENYVGLFAVQWGGNMTDEWVPDFLAAANFGWTPPEGPPPYDLLDSRIDEHLSRLVDASDPQPEEVDPPAWDGIWLKGNSWDRDILAEG